MKYCPDCDTHKPVEEFPLKNKVRGHRRPACAPCWRVRNSAQVLAHFRRLPAEVRSERSRDAYAKRSPEAYAISRAKRLDRAQEYVFTYLLSHPCADCGERDPLVLEFDHRDPALKEVTIGELVSHAPALERLSAEVAKCDVRCANCHRRKTARDGRHWRFQRLQKTTCETPTLPET